MRGLGGAITAAALVTLVVLMGSSIAMSGPIRIDGSGFASGETESRRGDLRFRSSRLLLALVARETRDGPSETGSLMASAGRWRAVIGTFRVRSLAGWASGQRSRASEIR